MNSLKRIFLPFSYLILLVLLASCSQQEAATGSWPVKEAGAQAAGFTEQGIADLDAAMSKIVDDQDVAGMVWLLAKDGKVATFKSHGMASLNQQTTMTNDSLFRIYSMSKPITGVAMMILHEEGKWDFDDPITKYVPELAGLQVMTSYDDEGEVTLEPIKRPATMRELMNHTAGFGYGLGGDDPVNTAFRDKGVLASKDLDELITKVSEIPLLYQPGEQWVYSIAVDIQGYIVQKISGQKFGDFLHERIFEPLQMNDTRFYVLPEDKNRFAEVHNWDKDTNALAEMPQRTDRPGFDDPNRLESGGGGLVSSTHDYARFLQMMVNGGELDGKRIISEQSVNTMRTNSLLNGMTIYQTDTRPGRPGIGFGVDFAVITDPVAAKTPQSEGTYYWAGAAGTWFWIDPKENMIWVGMIQAQGTRRPGAADMRSVANDIIYASLVK